MTACSSSARAAAKRARNSFIAAVETCGSTSAKASPVAGLAAAKRWAQV
jgi:hypothetical protein